MPVRKKMTCEAVYRRGTQPVDGTNNVQDSKRAPPLGMCVMSVAHPHECQTIRQCITSASCMNTAPIYIVGTTGFRTP